MTTVYLAACDRYEVEGLAAHVRRAMTALGVVAPAAGAGLLVPSCPWSHPRFAPTASAEPMVVEAVGRALGGSNVTIGAQALPGFPSRYCLRKAGFESVAGRLGASVVSFDERPFRGVAGPALPAGTKLELPAPWLDTPFRVLLPRLRGSMILPFAGALRELF